MKFMTDDWHRVSVPERVLLVASSTGKNSFRMVMKEKNKECSCKNICFIYSKVKNKKTYTNTNTVLVLVKNCYDCGGWRCMRSFYRSKLGQDLSNLE